MSAVSNPATPHLHPTPTNPLPSICLQTPANSAETLANDCDASQLTYACICANGLSPNVSEYSQTIPYYICQEWGNQCVSNCGDGNNQCASACREDHPCGAKDPTRVNSSTLTSTMSRTRTGTATGMDATATGDDAGGDDVVYTGFGGDSAAAATTGSGSGGDGGDDGEEDGGADAEASTSGNAAPGLRAAALGMGQTFGLLGVVGVISAAFAVLL